MAKLFRLDFTAMMRRAKLPGLLLIQPAITWLILLQAGSAPDEMHKWINVLEELLAVVVAAGLLYPIAVSVMAHRLRHDVVKMMAVFRPGLYVAAGLGAVVVFSESAILAAALLVSGGEDCALLAGAFALGGFVGLAILVLSTGDRRVDGTPLSRSLLLSLDEHPSLRECLVSVCAELNISLPDNILVGWQPEFFATAGTVTCMDGETKGSVLHLPVSTCRILHRREFEARLAAELAALQRESGEAQSEFRERLTGAIATAEDVRNAKDDWNWLPRHFFHPTLVALRFGLIVLIRMCIVLGAEWFAFFVEAFHKAHSESRFLEHVKAVRAATELYGAQWFVAGLEKEAALSLCAEYRLVRDDGTAAHPLGEILRRLPAEFRLQPKRPSSWRHPVAAWEGLRSRCEALGVSLDWCHQLALDVQPEPSAASLFADLPALDLQIVNANRKPFLPESARDRERRMVGSVLRLG